MNGRKAKAIRNYIKSMETKNGSTQQPQYTFQQLENYIQLHIMLTGEKPKQIEVTKAYYNWYIQECQKHADILGLNLGFRNEVPEFSGVMIKRAESKIETAK